MMSDDDLRAAFAAYTEGAAVFSRRMAIDIADFFNVTVKHVVRRLECLALLRPGSWDWFCSNGGFRKDHYDQARADRKAVRS